MTVEPIRWPSRPPPDVTIVTGAAGWFGRALLATLADPADDRHRRSIRALVTTADDAAELKALPGVEPVVGDVRSPAGLVDLFAGIGTATVDVIHAAGVIHPRTPSDWVEVNVRGTQHVATAARDAGVRRFVHVSSNSPFGTNPRRSDRFRNDEPYHPHLGYGRSKMLAELRLGDEIGRGLDAVIVRPPWFYGPHQPARQTRFFTLVRAGRFPVVGDGGQRRSMVYVGNLVDGVVRAQLANCPPGRAWWIADREAYTQDEIVAAVATALRDAGYRVAPRQRRVPEAVSRAAEAADRLLQHRNRYVAPLHVLGELRHTIACDVSVAIAELGYNPQVELAEGMRRSVAWCKEAGIAL